MNESSPFDARKLYESALAIMSGPSGPVHSRQAAALLRRSLLMGEPRAAYALGTWYLHGSYGFEKNSKKGLELITAAADAKVPSALFDLAVCFETGEGVGLDLEKAFLLYLDAAIRDDSEAVAEVGRCYSYGIGVNQDSTIAEIWNQRADELGTF